MNLIKRLRNLWRISEYRIEDEITDISYHKLVKDFPTIKKKLATIIQDKPNYFKNDTPDK